MKLLKISYNLSNNKNIFYGNEDFIYLINSVKTINSQYKQIMIVNNYNFDLKLIELLSKIKNYDYCLVFNNEIEYVFEDVSVENEDFIINGKIIKAQYLNGKLIAEHYDKNLFLLNLKEKLEYFIPNTIGDVIFPAFSEVIYRNRKKCLQNKIHGIKVARQNLNKITLL